MSLFFTLLVALTMPADQKSFKGWELYSWTDAKCPGSCFALMVGTNRNKTAEEIRRTPIDLAALENQIAHLATGEQVSWFAPDPTFQFPDAATVEAVKIACTKRGVQLALGR